MFTSCIVLVWTFVSTNTALVPAEPPTVVANDDINGASVLRDIRDGLYDSIVISPGPGTPHTDADVGALP